MIFDSPRVILIKMIKLIRKYIFAGAKKNPSAPYIFLVLCAYTVIMSVYVGILYSAGWLLIRLACSAAMIISYVALERTPLSQTLTACISPAILAGIFTFMAVYFKGDNLFFMYLCGITTISVTYFNKKGLAAYLLTVNAAIAVILFGFGRNLLGADYTMLYNYMVFIASIGLNALTYIFCLYFLKTLKALTEAEVEAKLAAQAKGSFLAKMSHEIRTPLNAIIGLAETELRKAKGADAAALRKIQNSGSQLLGIINDILDMSKIESGKFDINPAQYNFADMIYDTVTLNAVRIGKKPIKFYVETDENIPRLLTGDILRVKQLLSNLLSNAFKYTDKGSVTLRASARPEQDGMRIIFEIADTGKGIESENLKKLFQEYSQFNKNDSRYVEGTGLGLSICKGLAELMNGRVYAKSEFGKGSVFTAEIMQGIAGPEPVGADAAEALRSFTYMPEYHAPEVDFKLMSGVRVLVVDDVEINLEVAAAIMEPYGMQIDGLNNGADAVERIKTGEPRYNVIFMDHMMPGMDGIEAARAIREIGTEYAKSIPIIALTANAVAGSDKFFIKNGFQDFLAKPIEPQELDAVLLKWTSEK